MEALKLSEEELANISNLINDYNCNDSSYSSLEVVGCNGCEGGCADALCAG